MLCAEHEAVEVVYEAFVECIDKELLLLGRVDAIGKESGQRLVEHGHDAFEYLALHLRVDFGQGGYLYQTFDLRSVVGCRRFFGGRESGGVGFDVVGCFNIEFFVRTESEYIFYNRK